MVLQLHSLHHKVAVMLHGRSAQHKMHDGQDQQAKSVADSCVIPSDTNSKCAKACCMMQA